MAERVLRVGAIYGPDLNPGDERASGAGAYGATQVGCYAVVDMHDDGTEIERFDLLEADHTGIVAEWQTGTATTVIEGAINSAISGHSHTEPMTSTQRTNLIKQTVPFA